MRDRLDSAKLVCGLTAFLMLALAAMALEHHWTRTCLTDATALADGQIVEKHRSSGRGGPTFSLRYRFEAPAGFPREGWQRVDRARFDETAVGATVRAQFCASSPWRHTLDPRRLDTELSGFLIGTGLAALALVVYLLILAGLSIRAKRQFSRA